MPVQRLDDWNRDPMDYGYFRFRQVFTSTTDPILMKSGMSKISVALHPTPSASIEYTLSMPADVAAGTAKWIVWPLGTITASNADELMSTATAIRGIGNGTLEITAS
jgi:hypothetical protein